MSDELERRLADRLGALGETVDDELPPPVDLEFQVLRRRRRTRGKRRGAILAIAAAILAAVTTVAAVRGATGRRDTLRIASSSTTADPGPVRDALQPGTAVLSARGQFVVSLDATGKRNATMVSVEHGEVNYARATADHREIWYLSLKSGVRACGDVVREDVAAGRTKIVSHAVAFDVSPDGSRLALYGAGDLARNRCAPVMPGSPGRIVVLDLANLSSSAVTMDNVTSLQWSPDSAYLVGVSCAPGGCRVFRTDDIPRAPGAPLTVSPRDPSSYQGDPIRSSKVAFGAGGLYMLQATTPAALGSGTTTRVDLVDPRVGRSAVTVFSSRLWNVSQVIPTSAATLVVAAPTGTTDTGLYRVIPGKPSRLVLVRPLPGPGTLTAVTPLP